MDSVLPEEGKTREVVPGGLFFILFFFIIPHLFLKH